MITKLSNTQAKTLPLNKDNKYTTNNNQSTSPNFKGFAEAGTGLLNALNTNPAIGACGVDLFSMVLPRGIVDFSRSKDAGIETTVRESTGTINHGIAGFVGLGAGYLVSRAFNKANGVKAHFIFTDNKALDVYGEFIKNSHTGAEYSAEKYYSDILNNLQRFNTTEQGQEAWSKLPEQTIKEAKDILVNAKTNKYKTPSDVLNEVKYIITGDTGAGSTFKLNLPEDIAAKLKAKNPKAGTTIEASLENIINDSFAIRKTFLDKAAKDSMNIVKNADEFISKIKGLKLKTAAAGLAVPVIVGMSAQPINSYLTKKRTGKDGFVGVEGREPDKSAKFKTEKAIVGLGLGSAMIATILKKPTSLYTNIKKAAPEIFAKLQYKGIVPTMDQFKFIYGMTIMSRIFASRDKNEMRESGIKDTLGFANWLILGSFVSKLAAKAFKKGLVNYDKANGEGTWNFITKSVEKTHEEILYPTLKKLGIKVIENGKAKPFRKLMSEMAERAKSPEVSQELKSLIKETQGRLKYKNYAQMLGYIYSGVVLGVGIPKLNIAITKYFDGKNNAHKKDKTQNEKMKISTDYIPKTEHENKTFGAFLNSI